MTDIDVAALRAAAEGATPGPWEPDPDERGASDVISCYPERSLDWNNGDPTGTICQRSWDADAAYIAAANPAVVLELLDRLAAAEEKVSILEQVRADEWDADAPMPETATPEWGTEDYRRHAVLFNDITYCRIQRRLIFSDRLRLQRHLWALGWRRDVRDEDVTEGGER